MSSLAAVRGRSDNAVMTPEQAAAPALPLRPQDEMECRRCGVHCDKVVYPGACLSRGCPFVYSYEAWGHTYLGCMQKVYEVEIDIDMLRTDESRSDDLGCVNPEFDELPVGKPTFRVFARVTSG